MANTASAKKNVRKNESRRVRNAARRSAIKTAMKKMYALLETSSNKNNEQVEVLFKDIAAKLSRAKGKGLIHANTASRKLSRLSKRIAQERSA